MSPQFQNSPGEISAARKTEILDSKEENSHYEKRIENKSKTLTTML